MTSAEEGARHQKALQLSSGASVEYPAAGEGCAAHLPGTFGGRMPAVWLLWISSRSVPSPEVVSSCLYSCLDGRELCINNGFIPVHTSPFLFGNHPWQEQAEEDLNISNLSSQYLTCVELLLVESVLNTSGVLSSFWTGDDGDEAMVCLGRVW